MGLHISFMIYLFIMSTACIYFSLPEHSITREIFFYLFYLLIFKNLEQCMHKSSDICRSVSQYHCILLIRGPNVESQFSSLSLGFLHLK